MHDLETIKRMNQGAGHAPKVASDGRVCTEYHSRPVNKRFYVDTLSCSASEGCVADIIPAYHQGHQTFGPMPYGDAVRLCDLLNALTKV